MPMDVEADAADDDDVAALVKLAAVAEEALSYTAVDSSATRARLAQLLLLLAAEALLPEAGAQAQLMMAGEACGERGWPSLAADLTAGARLDLSCGSEIGMPELIEAADGSPAPPPFLYINECVAADIVPQWGATVSHLRGCTCCEVRTRFCVTAADSGRGCACHGGNRRECGHGCGCVSKPEACANRVLQRGLRKRLRVKRCDDEGKGWGVFAAEYIRKGDFVVEYVGELVSSAEADRRSEACPLAGNYQFLLPGQSGDRKNAMVIDGYAVRNVAAFINFSCDPNLCTQRIASASGDVHLPRVGFYAKKDIKPNEELGYRRDPNDRKRDKTIQCRCGAGDKCAGSV